MIARELPTCSGFCRILWSSCKYYALASMDLCNYAFRSHPGSGVAVTHVPLTDRNRVICAFSHADAYLWCDTALRESSKRRLYSYNSETCRKVWRCPTIPIPRNATYARSTGNFLKSFSRCTGRVRCPKPVPKDGNWCIWNASARQKRN